MQKYQGGCHCKEVEFEVNVDISKCMVCNCSHCEKKGFVLSFTPAVEFNL
jgi:hypothetical protein